MSTLLNLSTRLENIVKLCDNVSTIADIGCDHGYVSAELILSNKCDRVIATDISERSLNKAIRFCDSLNINNYISFRQGDGFGVIYKSDKVKQAVIAGMGGMEIIKILENKKINLTNFVLQPMRDVVKLRQYLIDNHYKILLDYLVFEDGIYYNIIKVTKGRNNLKPMEIYFGKDNFDWNSEVFKDYLLSEKEKLESLSEKIDGLTKKNESHLIYVEAGLTYLEKLQSGEIEYKKRRKFL
ncbi:MAG: tRNA (adenine(22)-N(1))-methyltransferase [Christensenellales bacterium]